MQMSFLYFFISCLVLFQVQRGRGVPAGCGRGDERLRRVEPAEPRRSAAAAHPGQAALLPAALRLSGPRRHPPRQRTVGRLLARLCLRGRAPDAPVQPSARLLLRPEAGQVLAQLVRRRAQLRDARAGRHLPVVRAADVVQLLALPRDARAHGAAHAAAHAAVLPRRGQAAPAAAGLRAQELPRRPALRPDRSVQCIYTPPKTNAQNIWRASQKFIPIPKLKVMNAGRLLTPQKNKTKNCFYSLLGFHKKI